MLALGVAAAGGLTIVLLALLTNIFERKAEARQPFVRVAEVTEATLDPAVWGRNWPSQYESYERTSLPTATTFGGRGLGASDGGLAEQKLDRDPWLKRIFAGYAFSIDYRDRRGHAFALFDQEQTRRVTEKAQPGACIQCHASNLALYRFAGKGDVQKGSEAVCAMSYQEAHDMKDEQGHALVQHPVACIDFHDPATMALRVTRPGFLAGIAALKASQGRRELRPRTRTRRAGDAPVRLLPMPTSSTTSGKPARSSPTLGRTASRSADRDLHDRRLHRLDHAERRDEGPKAQPPRVHEVWNRAQRALRSRVRDRWHMPLHARGRHEGQRPRVRSPCST
jgi:nitrite reductase (cytochrome c-552)